MEELLIVKIKNLDRIVISSEDEKQILSIADMPDAYDKLIASFAPHIYGHEIIKESILLLIVGSVTKKLADGSNRRGDINIFPRWRSGNCQI